MVDWGSVPDWLAGCGAVAALFWARRAAAIANRTDERQAEQLAGIALQERRQQAAGVAAWTSLEGGTVRLCVRNATELPVYDFAAIFDRIPTGRTRTHREKVLPPDTGAVHDVDVVEDGAAIGPPGVAISFRDASGYHWYRAAGRDLIETTRASIDRYLERIDTGGDPEGPEPVRSLMR